MNWVGGKLQRHAKANANKRQKAQRQYFARARQSHHHTDAPLSPPALAHYHDPRPNPSARPHQLDQLQQRNRFSGQASKPPAHTSRMYADQKSSDPLENAKRRLLDKTDWTAVAAARPLHIMFESASEMQRIGRRKRVSRGNNGRHPAGPFNRPLVHDKRTLRALAQVRNLPYQSGSEAKDYSIRIGSNLHHTQTTKHASSHHTLSSGPMILEPAEPRHQRSTAATEELYLQQSPALPRDAIQDNLLPLSEARDLSSFDDIKEQSSSIVRRASVSSNPFTVRHHPKPRSKPPSRGEEASSQGPHASQKADSPCASENEADLLPGPLPLQDTNTRAERNSIAPQYWEVIPSMSDPELSRPRFTIDHQVLLERRLFQSSSNSLPRVQDESPSLPQLTNPTHFPGIGEPGRHQTSAVRSSYFSSPLNRGDTTVSDVLDDERPAAKRRRTEAAVDSKHDRQPEPQPRVAIMASSSSYREHVPKSDHLLCQERPQQPKQNRNQCFTSPPKPSQRHPKERESVGDENEAWMKYVFPNDFDRIQNAFTLQPVPHLSRLSSPEAWTDNPLSTHGGVERHDHETRQLRPASSRISIPSDVNTSLYRQNAVTQVAHKSETDFLSRLSPMEGFLDERLGPISSYTNAATSTRAYVSMPSVSMQSDLAASTNRLAYRASPTHRRPFLPQAQRRLWKPQISDDIFPVSSMSPPTPADPRKISSPLWNSSDPPHANLSPHPVLRSARFGFGIEAMKPPNDY